MTSLHAPGTVEDSLVRIADQLDQYIDTLDRRLGALGHELREIRQLLEGLEAKQ